MLKKLTSVAGRLRQELAWYQQVLRHPRTPTLPKMVLSLAVGYLLMPIDLIPDFIPVIGHLDDAIIIPLLIMLALRLVPEDILQECRASVG